MIDSDSQIMRNAQSEDKILSIRGLRTWFHGSRGGWLWGRKVCVRAVDGIDLEVDEGTIFGIVGESGCGKSTLIRSLVGLEPFHEGEVRLRVKGTWNRVDYRSRQSLRQARRQMQVVFQNPFASVNPRQTIFEIIAEPAKVNGVAHGGKLRDAVFQLLEQVGLPPAHAFRYPGSFSGGQLQRVVIARALVMHPSILLADEPVSALDVSVQAQILNMLLELKLRYGLTVIFISHNLNVVRHMSDRLGVMYLGRMVEIGDAAAIYEAPRHPYTQSLVAAVPGNGGMANPDRRKALLKGEPPDPANPPTGCAYHPRCPWAESICREKEPEWAAVNPEWSVRCHRWNQIASREEVSKAR